MMNTATATAPTFAEVVRLAADPDVAPFVAAVASARYYLAAEPALLQSTVERRRADLEAARVELAQGTSIEALRIVRLRQVDEAREALARALYERDLADRLHVAQGHGNRCGCADCAGKRAARAAKIAATQAEIARRKASR